MYRKFGRGTYERQAKTMKRQLPAAVNMIAELGFLVSAMLIIFGAFFGMFGSHPSLAIISVDRFLSFDILLGIFPGHVINKSRGGDTGHAI